MAEDKEADGGPGGSLACATCRVLREGSRPSMRTTDPRRGEEFYEVEKALRAQVKISVEMRTLASLQR